MSTTSTGSETRLGRADLHIHSLASDGTASALEILRHARDVARLDVIAITDHERIDAAVAARELAAIHEIELEVIVGEEITTRSGHLLGLFLTERIRPFQSLKASVAQVHEQGGIAIIAHPLVPYPLCASAGSIRRLLAERDPVYHPDAIEAFNPTTARMPWHGRVAPFVAQTGVAAVASSDAHRLEGVGQAITMFPGRTAADIRAAILARQTTWSGEPYTWTGQLGTFRRQLAKNARAVRDDLGGLLLRRGSGRDLGYPGGRRRPARFDPAGGGSGRIP